MYEQAIKREIWVILITIFIKIQEKARWNYLVYKQWNRRNKLILKKSLEFTQLFNSFGGYAKSEWMKLIINEQRYIILTIYYNFLILYTFNRWFGGSFSNL